MRNPKIVLLGSVAALFAALLLWNWISGWGLVTLNYDNAPLSKVIKSIESQGWVKIATNADLATPVSIRVKRVPAYEAIDTLAERIDGEARLAFIAAPDSKQIAEVLSAYTTGAEAKDWSVFASGFGGGTIPVGSEDTVPDPRNIVWKVSDVPDKTLQALFEQGAQKTGALFAAPKSWNPTLAKLPAEGKTGAVATDATGKAKGQIKELFLVTVRPPRPEPTAGERPASNGNRWEGGRTALSPQRGGRDRMNPDWMAERVESQIAMLPPEERAEAQKQFNEMRAFWASVRDLPEEERRAKIEEQMNKPEVQERMQQAMESRDTKAGPQRRQDRMRRYIERKQAIKSRSS